MVVYLAAGTDYTNRFFGKTHSNFLSTWLKHIEFIGDLTVKDSCTGTKSVNMEAVRKLIHCVYMKVNKHPASITYSATRDLTKSDDIRKQQPTESVIYEIIKRIQGTFRYMMSYISPAYSVSDWTKFGFHLDHEQNLIPTLIPSVSHVTVAYGDQKLLCEHNYACFKHEVSFYKFQTLQYL